MKQFPFYKQADSKDSPLICLKIIAKYYDLIIPIQELRELSTLSKNKINKSNLLDLSNVAEKIGFRSLRIELDTTLLQEISLPCILYWDRSRYVVLYKIHRDFFYISDPVHGLLNYTKNDFINHWIGNSTDYNSTEGTALLLETTPKLYERNHIDENRQFGITFLLKYVTQYKTYIWQLVIGLIAASIIQLLFPFLTQSVVDIGIKHQDIHFVYLILFAQLSLYIGKTALEIIRSWILLHLSTRINIALISDFFIKLMKLPMAYFDTKMTGDILQRINDHKRIEKILTSSSLSTLFSVIHLFIFSSVLAFYNLKVLVVFILGSTFYFFWVILFLKKRRNLDYKQFSQISHEQSKVIELINGMQEIKLHNAEKEKRWGWEFLQVKLFKISVKSLALEQYQNVGAKFINELKNIFINVLSATLVINGELTLGMMLAVSYIVGQLNSPMTQLINFIRALQDAKISMERLSEIHNTEEEEKKELLTTEITHFKNLNFKISQLSFKYSGSNQFILNNLNLNIPHNKITAIVGESGSGKTTLMKLLLKFYAPNQGHIKIGNYDLQYISPTAWRQQCGAVMQEGYIFNDTIANNIAVGATSINIEKLVQAVKIANIKDFIEHLPLSYNTKIGLEGIGLSTGQKQRLLIARSVYKNPHFLFFDEATSALDANNEKVIVENLATFFKNKTVLIIAHRLSTVRNAHQIVVLNKGQIIETGNHDTLIKQKGHYFNLVKNQLELGN